MGTYLINKVTRPRISRVIPRRRLFELLRQAEHASAVWLAGPAGTGKTSLMASYLVATERPLIWYQIDAGDGDLATFFYYLGQAATPVIDRPNTPLPLLTPEYLLGVETFAIRYFEKLFQRLAPPVWIVFDNFQELPADSPAPSIVAKAIEQAPPGIRVAIISRHDPPPCMARLLANQLLTTIGSDQLAFSLDECRELIDILNGDMTDEDVARLYQVTKGWVAGLILWLLQKQMVPGSRETIVDDMPASVFDYFADEVLDRTDERTRQFLLQTALMPHMTAETAGRLTGMPAADILDRLNRRNLFLEKRQLATASYQYHPLFSDFLRLRAARTFSHESLEHLRRRAAGIMAAAGFAEEAVDLYRQAQDYEAMIGLILNQAPILAAQGRNRTLTGWINSLPEAYVDHQPWLLFWKGMGLMPSLPLDWSDR